MSKEIFSKGSKTFGDMNKRRQRVLKDKMKKYFKTRVCFTIILTGGK